MPNAIVLTLQRRNEAPLPAAAGETAHAACFALLGRGDADLAEKLHASGERKPFTVGWPEEEAAERPTAGSLALLRITFLDDSLFAALADALLQGGLQEGLRLGEARFDITGLLATPGTHPQAGCASYADLRDSAEAAERVRVRFVTPTAFRSQSMEVLWPEPRLVWQSWARAWNDYAAADDLRVDEDRLVGLAETRVRVERYHLQTRRVPLTHGALNGFLGYCAFSLRALDPPDRRALTALANFAFYSGTGRKTAMGMGQTRPTRKEEKS